MLQCSTAHHLMNVVYSAGIFKQSTVAKEPKRNRVVVPARQAAQCTQPGGIGFLESFLRLLKSLKIRALLIKKFMRMCICVHCVLGAHAVHPYKETI
jgi:hypothetical protein